MRELRVVLKALADVSRLRIIAQLAFSPEISVSELAVAVRCSQPLISWHLRILRKARLVTTRRVGRVVYCSLDRERLSWCQAALRNLSEAALSDKEARQPAVGLGGYAEG